MRILRHGVSLRRAGRLAEARESLRLAVDLAQRRGATVLEERALAELRAAGGRPRRRRISGAGSLTTSERRVAALAAAGRMNREIAEELVVTLGTVEYHLRNVYRKLGISSRSQLSDALETRPRHAQVRLSIRVLDRATAHWPSLSSAATSSLPRHGAQVQEVVARDEPAECVTSRGAAAAACGPAAAPVPVCAAPAGPGGAPATPGRP
jgi:DNA-binding CsgD family transcriptional regulator